MEFTVVQSVRPSWKLYVVTDDDGKVLGWTWKRPNSTLWAALNVDGGADSRLGSRKEAGSWLAGSTDEAR